MTFKVTPNSQRPWIWKRFQCFSLQSNQTCLKRENTQKNTAGGMINSNSITSNFIVNFRPSGNKVLKWTSFGFSGPGITFVLFHLLFAWANKESDGIELSFPQSTAMIFGRIILSHLFPVRAVITSEEKRKENDALKVSSPNKGPSLERAPSTHPQRQKFFHLHPNSLSLQLLAVLWSFFEAVGFVILTVPQTCISIKAWVGSSLCYDRGTLCKLSVMKKLHSCLFLHLPIARWFQHKLSHIVLF